MATLCLDTSLETLRLICYRGTHHLQGDLCCCFHERSLRTVQVVVMLLASHVLQNSPPFTVLRVEVWTLWGPILGTDKGCNIPPQPLLSHLGFWAGTESCWKTHSCPPMRVMLSCFKTPYSTSLDTLGHQFHPFLAKMTMCHPLMRHLPPNHDIGRVMAFLHPQNAPQGTFEHKSCSGCYTASRLWKISLPWRGYFRARSQRATRGDALL